MSPGFLERGLEDCNRMLKKNLFVIVSIQSKVTSNAKSHGNVLQTMFDQKFLLCEEKPRKLAHAINRDFLSFKH